MSLAAPVTLSFALLLALSSQAGAQTPDFNDPEVARFFTGCQPLAMLVEDLPPDAAEIGITVERLQTLAESRLRVARLYDEVSPYIVYVRVIVIGLAYSTEVQFVSQVLPRNLTIAVVAGSDNPPLDVLLRMTTLNATVWTTSGAGMHGQDADNILQAVSESLDEFILEYLRVNESACEGPSLP